MCRVGILADDKETRISIVAKEVMSMSAIEGSFKLQDSESGTQIIKVSIGL